MIIVLSDANAAFSLPPDEARQKIVWVDDFSKEEAYQYLNNAKFLLGFDLKRNEIFEKIGTRVAVLEKMIGEGINLIFTIGESNVDAYAADVVDRAKATLQNLLKLKFSQNPDTAINFKANHEELLKSPNGVLASHFEDGATVTNLPRLRLRLCQGRSKNPKNKVFI